MSCIFCRIIKGEIPCMKLAETPHALAFLDISPLSKGHCLVIPKFHAEQLHQLPDDALAQTAVLLGRVARAVGGQNYNVLQNNGALAHQAVFHVHFHIIPKTSQGDGLGIRWNCAEADKGDLASLAKEIVAKMEATPSS